MKHTLIYMGRFFPNIETLTPATSSWVNEAGERLNCDEPAAAVDGISFGYMEKPGSRFFAVRVGSVILNVPFQLSKDRHCDGKGFGPTPSQFGDDSARAILADAIRANPLQAESILHAAWQSIAKA